MSNLPTVSVIIPIYNRFDLLERTCKSLLLQNFKNFEVILIDDCSEEKINLNHLKSILVGLNIHYKRLEINSGPGKARSVGRQLANGKYVAYLDSDDEWDKNFLAKTVEVLEKNNKASMVFTNTLIKTKNGNRKRNKMDSGFKNFFSLIINKKTYWATGAALWRAEVSLSQNWSGYRDHEDYYHDIVSLYHQPDIFYLSDILCVINKNDNLGITRSNQQMFKVLIEILKKFLKRKKESQVDFLKFVLDRLKKRKYSIFDFYYFIVMGNIFLSKGYFKNYIDLYKLYLKRLK